MSQYYRRQRDKQQALVGTPIFGNTTGNGLFMGKRYPFILQDGKCNLFSPFEEVKQYLKENDITWWGGDKPTGHILSSQMACFNHLFPLKNDKEAVLKLLNGVIDEFVDVLPISCDKSPQYIAFEVVSKDDHLNELNTTRGSNCTSIDALIYAKHKSGKLWLIPIEWKYTEHYGTDDKSSGEKGATRKSRYNDLIAKSAFLKDLSDYSVYYQEPFYQLMRQTLWTEQVIRHRDTEVLKADDYLHIHIIPSENEALLRNRTRFPYKVSGKGMEDTWRYCIKDQSKYVIVDPKDFLSPIADKYSGLFEYLSKRYW